MAQNIVSDYLKLINYLIHTQEILFEYHLKAEAMLEVLLDSNLHHCPKAVLYNYLWALSDIMVKAKNLNEPLLNGLIKLKNMVELPNKLSGN